MFFYIGARYNTLPNEMITVILVLATIGYIAQIFFLRAGIEKATRISTVMDAQPSVSIVVAARNEEHRIAECLRSLIRIDYPPEKIEIIVVNDGSTDRTAEIIGSFMGQHPSLRIVTSKAGSGNLRGKANAVAQGIDVSTGEILMFTDADCYVPPGWVSATVKYFTDETGVVGGFTLLDADRTFEGMQALDWIFLFGLSSAAAGWNVPLTAIGNNLSVRRSAYNATGGYQKIPFSVTEDYALVQSILRNTKYRLRFPADSMTIVRSKACQTWSQLYHQKQRWGVGGLDMIISGMLIMTVGWSAKLSLLLMLVTGHFIPFIVLSLGTISAELCFLWRPLKRFHALEILKHFPAFTGYFFVYVLLMPFIAYFSKKVVWKERNL
ncbi:MAG: glycosyltransferase [Ignavibacteria bacterium]|nr:glycosyltransferase [Ignavibacteria bacterium]